MGDPQLHSIAVFLPPSKAKLELLRLVGTSPRSYEWSRELRIPFGSARVGDNHTARDSGPLDLETPPTRPEKRCLHLQDEYITPRPAPRPPSSTFNLQRWIYNKSNS